MNHGVKNAKLLKEDFLNCVKVVFFDWNSIKKIFKGQFIVLGKLEIDFKYKHGLEYCSRLKFKYCQVLELFNEDNYASSIEF